MAYLYLAISIVSEVIGTSLLKVTSNFTKPIPTIGVVICYGTAFFYDPGNENSTRWSSLCHLVGLRDHFDFHFFLLSV